MPSLQLFNKILILVTVVYSYPEITPGTSNAQISEMENYLKKLSSSFYRYTNLITRHDEVRDAFLKSPGGSIEDIDLENMFHETITKINNSFTKRAEAIYKLANNAEQMALGFYSKPQPPILKPTSYYNSKHINKIPPTVKSKDGENDDDDKEEKETCTGPVPVELINSNHFKSEVNMSFTSVHIPTSIYECDQEVLKALEWSSDLEIIFKDNYKGNPLLGFQYFGSSTGFMRQYPATKWNDNVDKTKPPDLYDCRFRPWYTLSATSPKNILILQDVSGSMKGMRSTIAKAVVNTILDTLTVNDYVSVFTYNDTTKVLVDCFNESGKPELVQATLTNVRELRVGLEQTTTVGIANLTNALQKAFDTLRDNEAELGSANCNQAIMVITDGAPQYLQDLFNQRNPDKRIRLFTYLVGREVTDYREVQWMACYNQGYYVHVSTLGEVQEQVLKYIPVMSRPLVMSQKRSVMWTGVYADLAEVVESEWRWNDRTREEQRKRSRFYKTFLDEVHTVNSKKGKDVNKSKVLSFTDGNKIADKSETFKYLKHKVSNFLDYGTPNVTTRFIRKTLSTMEREKRIQRSTSRGGPFSLLIPFSPNKLLERNEYQYKEYDPSKFRFVISASYPVYDIRNYTNQTGSEERIANFLGVIGTDIPLEEIKQLTSPFRLGVNAYAFIVTNNGHVVFHPDYRPLHDDILKPTYNSVDLMEVELIDRDDVHRNNDSNLLQFRDDMIESDEYSGPNVAELDVRLHRDKFTRAFLSHHRYIYGKIPKTTYSLALQIPHNATRFTGQVELSRLFKDSGVNAMQKYFNFEFSRERKRQWKLHPDWVYCEYLNEKKGSKEEIFAYFVKKIQSAAEQRNSTFAWGDGFIGTEGRDYRCDRDLVQSVIFDARSTQIFADSEKILEEPKLLSLVQNTGTEELKDATLIRFIGTRSGLTRWIDRPLMQDDTSHTSDLEFQSEHARTIDESYYKRAVERSRFDEDSYIISVEPDSGVREFAKVTVSRAIVAAKGTRKAAVGVAGAQFNLNLFLKYWGISPESTQDKRNICNSPEYDCFILDDNGFIIGSENNREDSGRFIGEIDGNVLKALLNSSIYKMVIIRDFQGICAHNIEYSSLASKLLTPWVHMKELLGWMISYLLSFSMHFNLDFAFGESISAKYVEDEYESVEDGTMPLLNLAKINKTKLRPCDKEYKLFTYGDGYSSRKILLEKRAHTNNCEETCDDYLTVFRIPYTNLIKVIVKGRCRSCNPEHFQGVGWREIKYPVYKAFQNKDPNDPVYQELCRTPQLRTMHRKRLRSCYNYDDDELIMKEDCGLGSNVCPSTLLMATVLIVMLIFPANS